MVATYFILSIPGQPIMKRWPALRRGTTTAATISILIRSSARKTCWEWQGLREFHAQVRDTLQLRVCPLPQLAAVGADTTTTVRTPPAGGSKTRMAIQSH